MNTTSHPHWLKPHHLALLVFVNLMWGMNMLTTKFGVREIPPIFFSGLRLSIMLLVCLPWLRWFPGQMANLFGVAMFTGAGGFGLLALGVGLSKDISTVAIFAQLIVPFSALLSVLMLGEVIHWRRKTGIALAFIGVFIIGFDPRAFSYVAGLSCVALQGLSAALGMVYVKRLRGINPMQLQAWIAVIALPVMLGLSFMFEHDPVSAACSASYVAWGSVLVAVIGSSLIGQSGLFYLLKHYPVSSVAPLMVLTTVFGMIGGVLFNRDVLTVRMLIGGVITLIGVLIIELRTRQIVIETN